MAEEVRLTRGAFAPARSRPEPAATDGTGAVLGDVTWAPDTASPLFAGVWMGSRSALLAPLGVSGTSDISAVPELLRSTSLCHTLSENTLTKSC